MVSFKSHIQCQASAPLGLDLTLANLLTIGLINWDGVNTNINVPCNSMQLAASIGERLLTCLESAEAQVWTLENTLQLQVSGMDALLNQHSEDHHFLLGQNAALKHEVEGLKQGMAALEGEFSVLVAWMEGLEWLSSSKYLSMDELLCIGTGEELLPLSLEEALVLGSCHPWALN
ncbi:hypothetical protein BDM02DRAFT_3192584 [Thelephora ganbajun]|uniref:Uncharacterized protein n=1 Tax=Thelephora ganbajun TaxID=370292 RepID=A0ACB6Z017_THEGA|nr:hypothetical protein BDM02DRAFT_3192584 [Thelephora ganbajun]